MRRDEICLRRRRPAGTNLSPCAKSLVQCQANKKPRHFRRGSNIIQGRLDQKSMPLMPPPPMPPPGIALLPALSLGRSAIIASVVISSEATDAASCRHAHHFGPVDDALFHHVDILFVLRVEAEVAGLLQHLADHNRAFDPGVLDDLDEFGSGVVDPEVTGPLHETRQAELLYQHRTSPDQP